MSFWPYLGSSPQELVMLKVSALGWWEEHDVMMMMMMITVLMMTKTVAAQSVPGCSPLGF